MSNNCVPNPLLFCFVNQPGSSVETPSTHRLVFNPYHRVVGFKDGTGDARHSSAPATGTSLRRPALVTEERQPCCIHMSCCDSAERQGCRMHMSCCDDGSSPIPQTSMRPSSARRPRRAPRRCTVRSAWRQNHELQHILLCAKKTNSIDRVVYNALLAIKSALSQVGLAESSREMSIMRAAASST
jgi:hypothetical protein